MIVVVHATFEFMAWFNDLSMRTQGLIESRIYRIENNKHFGDCKNIGNGISELRWRNGCLYLFFKTRRTVYTFIKRRR